MRAMVDTLLMMNWSQIIAAMIMTFGGGALLWYRKRVASWHQSWLRVFAGLQAIPELQTDVKGIRYFVSPNGGGSLMDLTRRLEATVGTITTQLELLTLTTTAENDTDDTIARFHCGADGANIYVNQTYARWLGVGKADLLGWNFLNVIHPSDVGEVHHHWEQCRREQRQYRKTHRVIATSGEVITLSVTVTPIPETGPVRVWVGYARRVESEPAAQPKPQQ